MQANGSGEIQRRRAGAHPSLVRCDGELLYLHAGNTSPDFWVDIAQTYLELIVAQNWQKSMKPLEREGKNPKEWVHFKEAHLQRPMGM